ncbi:hypothetical protein LTR99_004941 [Exophiala xenobiotica]|uniref:Uncharacterized protein n=1 Tax=Vermiconidia calcicola TaxID=1690605 RepID=A0AAV9QFL1_9PEZI|nr:hypothetical protein H2202_007989 [Exophiala xenobiotica]KAK5536392.1 hypothetical protein LTR23_007971 [Chaetothyriales sp. CCFEE 6169]KAK5540220.1 hypothetical protein LTR25_003926 [Vermiconidia calcicola]KAK5265877.1 hypothetical protein LTR96_008777 [Exophiala xenobiotica]KAK5304484.1 hypothetical protein LTR99_004941 [Exophiala xenobiotica]
MGYAEMTSPNQQQPAQSGDAEQQHDSKDKTNAEEENYGDEQDENASGDASRTTATPSLMSSSPRGTGLGHHTRSALATHAEDSDTVNEDETSSSGSSEYETTPEAEVEQADESEDEGTVASTGAAAPVFAGGDLQSRLQAFLPQLERANAELTTTADALGRRVDHVDDDEEHYIEMDLGLGVLSERRKRREGEIRVDREDSSSDGTENDDEVGDGKEGDEEEMGQQTNILARLRGEKASGGTKRKIEDLG